MYNYYVTMVDKFMSGWGMSEDRENMLLFICETYEEAEAVQDNGINRSDMRKVELHTSYPNIDEDRYFVQVKTKEDMPKMYVGGAF